MLATTTEGPLTEHLLLAATTKGPLTGPLLLAATKPGPLTVHLLLAPILVRLPAVARRKRRPSPEEKELVATMKDFLEEAEDVGRAKDRVETLLEVLAARGIAVSRTLRKRIMAEQDLKLLRRWFKKALTASSIDEVLGEAS
ncbi:MAG: hypothetical protein U0359_30630 [Byssovorax sp.]